MLLQLLFGPCEQKDLAAIADDISKSRGNISYIDFRDNETSVNVNDEQTASQFWDHFLQTESFLLLSKGGF